MQTNKIKELISNNHLDAVLLISSENRYWATNFWNSSGYYYVDKNDNHLLFLDGRYITAAKKVATNCEIIKVKDVLKDINKKIKHLNNGVVKPLRIGIESDFCTLGFVDLLKKEIDDAEFISISTKNLRIIKTNSEIETIQHAINIADETLIEVLNNFKIGKTETDLQKEILKSFIDKNVEQSFKCVINSGIKGAEPHGKASDKKIIDGELLTIDFGCVYSNYHTDMTRTVAIGKVSDELINIYETVKKAQQAGVDASIKGTKASDVHKIVYDVIKDAGYEKYFLHQTGHGVGLITHEAPRIADYDDTILENGMIVTIEPGIYIEGIGGVRIEDMVLINDDKAKVLTHIDKNLTNILNSELKVITHE